MPLVLILCVAALSTASNWREDVISSLEVKPSWTIMLYLDGDEAAMEGDFLDAFRDMVDAKAGSSAKVNIIVQFDVLKQVAWTPVNFVVGRRKASPTGFPTDSDQSKTRWKYKKLSRRSSMVSMRGWLG